jgi:uncharacterized membrane protein/predicted DsbA family dithiol-disulfide isomerase
MARRFDTPWGFRTLLALRLSALAGLTVSAMLVADAVNPGRGFCPLEEACALAGDSPLGSVLGVPTARIGAVAFALLFVLSVLPHRLARAALRPAGLLAALAGVTFLGYQALVLHSFCPLCVVADSAGIVAGIAVLTGWATTGSSAGFVETTASRMAWLAIGVIAVGAPLAWPRPEPEPALIPVPELALEQADLALAREVPLEPSTPPTIVESPDSAATRPTEVERPSAVPAPSSSRGIDTTPQVTPPVVPVAPPPESAAPPDDVIPATIPQAAPPLEPPVPARPPEPPPAEPVTLPPAPPAPPAPPVIPVPVVPPPPPAAIHAAEQPVAARETVRPKTPPPAAVSKPAAPPRAAEPAKAAAPKTQAAAPVQQAVITEFLNPFCPHCRATHARLENVLRTIATPVRRYRVYVWSSGAPPLWAQACAAAASSGKEDVLFAELLRASRDVPNEIWAAVRRAGLDPSALDVSIRSGNSNTRLQAERHRVSASAIRRLPTLDIGKWRLEGEPSEAELRNAINVAVAAASPARGAPGTSAGQ